MREEPNFDALPVATRSQETVFLNSGGVTVTNARFVVPGQTYAMAGLTSVKYHEQPQKWIAGAVCGALAAWWFTIGDYMLPLAIVFAIFSPFALWRGRRRYDVILSTSSGEVRALSSHARDDIREVVKALNNAIIYRG